MGVQDWLPAIFRSPDPRVEDANSAAGAPVGSNEKLPLVTHDGALAAEEAKPIGNEKPPQNAAPQNLNADNILTANANPPGKSTSSEQSSGWFQINRNPSTWEIYRNPDGPDGTPNPFSSLRDTVPRPFISAPSSEVYTSSPRGPLRIVNTDSPTDSQAPLEFILPPDDTKIQMPGKTYWASGGPVPREEFNEFKQIVDQILQKSATQLLLDKKQAWDMERTKDAKIYELERHVRNLQAAMARAQESSNEHWNRKTLQEPQTYVKQGTLVSDSAFEEAQSVYDSLPHKLRQVAVELALTRADVAKARRDWVYMEDHSAYAAELAKPLNDGPISARCEFYRGIALFGQRRWAAAYQAFEAGKFCVGIYVSAEEAEGWRQRLMQALNESPSQSQVAASIPMSTPIDQTLFQGFEHLGNISSQMETPEDIPHSSPVVPVLRQPVPPAVLRSRSGVEQRITYVPRRLDNTIPSPVFQPALRHLHRVRQRPRSRAISDDNFPSVANPTRAPSSEGLSPLNPSRHPVFADGFMPISQEETNGESLAPASVTKPPGRASTESDSAADFATGRPILPIEALSTGRGGPAPSHQSGMRHYPRDPSRLSEHFGPESQPSEPLGRPEVSQQLVRASKRFLLESSSSSSRFMASNKPGKKPTPPARQYASASDPSIIEPLLSRGGPIAPASFVYPPPPHGTLSSGTSYTGSANISPQTRPPDLDDNRQEFPVLSVVNPSPRLNSPGSTHSKFETADHPERSRTPLTEEALALFEETQAMSRSTSAQRSEFGLLAGRPPPRDWRNSREHSREHSTRVLQGLAPGGQPLNGLDLGSAESISRAVLDITDEGARAREATDLTRASPAEGISMGQLHANQLETEQRTSNERQIQSIQPQLSDVQKTTDNGMGGSGEEETQPGHALGYERKRSRNDPDFNSLYDVSTGGTISASIADAGDGIVTDVDIKRAELDVPKFNDDIQRTDDNLKKTDVNCNGIDVEGDKIGLGIEKTDDVGGEKLDLRIKKSDFEVEKKD